MPALLPAEEEAEEEEAEEVEADEVEAEEKEEEDVDGDDGSLRLAGAAAIADFFAACLFAMWAFT